MGGAGCLGSWIWGGTWAQVAYVPRFGWASGGGVAWVRLGRGEGAEQGGGGRVRERAGGRGRGGGGGGGEGGRRDGGGGGGPAR